MSKQIGIIHVLPLTMRLILGMVNYDVNSEGWQNFNLIMKQGNFKSQGTNFSKYVNPLIQKGIAEKRWSEYKDNKKRKCKLRQYRLKRNPNTFNKVFLIFFDNGIIPLFIASKYYQDLQEYMMANIKKEDRGEFMVETLMFPEFYAYNLLEGGTFQNTFKEVTNLINKHYQWPLLTKDFIYLSFAIVNYMKLLLNEKGCPYPKSLYSVQLESLKIFIDQKMKYFQERVSLLNVEIFKRCMEDELKHYKEERAKKRKDLFGSV